MGEPYLVDNDVVLKVAAYSLNDEILFCLTSNGAAPAIIGVGRFVVRRKAASKERFKRPDRVTAVAKSLLDELQVVEPTQSEVELAADLEAEARHLGGGFDVGEALLFAILLTRGSPALVTGDKRAIAAASDLDTASASGRIICLEQLVSCFARIIPPDQLRRKICSEPLTDRALSNCFACASVDVSKLELSAVLAALESYIDHIRRRSGNLLMHNADVLALAS